MSQKIELLKFAYAYAVMQNAENKPEQRIIKASRADMLKYTNRYIDSKIKKKPKAKKKKKKKK